MKLLLIFVFLNIGSLFAFAQWQSPLLLNVIKARDDGNSEEIVRLITQAESLRSENQASYLDFQTQAAVKLEKTQPADVLLIFDNVMNKTVPASVTDQRNYFLKKGVFILRYARFDGTQFEKQRLLNEAKFLGEVRGATLPGYPIKRDATLNDALDLGWYSMGTNSQAYLTTTIANPKSKVATKEQLRNTTNELQMVLSKVDRALLPPLLTNWMRFSTGEAQDIDFTRQIISVAKLTAAETEILMAQKPK